MYLEMLCATVLAGAPSQTVLKSRITSASVFKPGLVFIVREVQVPAGNGSYRVDFLPDALDGSFWYSAKGVKVNQVETRMKIVETKQTIKPVSIFDHLAANIGKKVTMVIEKAPKMLGGPTEVESVKGVLLDAGRSNQLTLKTLDGALRAVDSSKIKKLFVKGQSNTIKVTSKKADIAITFDAVGNTPGVVEFITMENCAAWTSSYMINLNNEADATIVGKAQIAIGGIAFNDTEVSVVAGMPNMPSMTSPNNSNERQVNRFDLASGFGSLIAYLKGSQEGYRQYRGINSDPYTYIPNLSRTNQPGGYQSGYYGSYGMGGYGGGGYGGAMDASSLSAAAEPYGPDGGYDNRNTIDKMARVEDVFAYPVGKLNMDPGERITRLLFTDEANYKRIFRWDLDDARRTYDNSITPLDRVAKIVRVANKTKTPWTAGKCIVTKDGTPLAQIEMPFTAVGQDANLELGTVQDILTKREAKELKREQVWMPYYDTRTAVTVEDKLTVTNARVEPVEVEVQYSFSGAHLSSDADSVRIVGLVLNALNPYTRAVWTVKLKPGESKELKLTRKTVL